MFLLLKHEKPGVHPHCRHENNCSIVQFELVSGEKGKSGSNLKTAAHSSAMVIYAFPCPHGEYSVDRLRWGTLLSYFFFVPEMYCPSKSRIFL